MVNMDDIFVIYNGDYSIAEFENFITANNNNIVKVITAFYTDDDKPSERMIDVMAVKADINSMNEIIARLNKSLITQLRLKYNLTQLALSKITNVPWRTIQRLEILQNKGIRATHLAKLICSYVVNRGRNVSVKKLTSSEIEKVINQNEQLRRLLENYDTGV